MLWFGVQIIPHHAEYRLISRQVLEAFKQYGEVNIFIRGIFPFIGFKSCEITYKRDPRFAGKTKYPLKAMLKFGFEGITSFSVVPLRIASVVGAFVCFITLLASAWGVITFLKGNTIPGWTSTVLPIYFLGGVQLIFLGLLGEYIGKIFLEVKKKYTSTIFFDGDKFREIFQNDINYTLKDRDINAMRLTRLVKNLSLQKINIIISANLTNIKFRKWMRRNVKNYYEIYISASLKSLLKRDYKKLYSKAINKKIKNVVGVDLPFNEPKNSDLYLKNNNEKKIFLKSVDKILRDIKSKKKNFF